jgi:diguanylate cyclase (GGDEF)-like protein
MEDSGVRRRTASVMSPVAARLSRHAHAVPPTVALAALGSAALTAIAVVAGSHLGSMALVLVFPAALAAAAARRRIDAHQTGLMHLAHLDPLTGLGNARQLRTRLDYELARHRRMRRRLTVFVLDLDGFKSVNDRFGHVAGDEVLREIARQLQRTVREQDTVVRQGGDEFCVLAPETGWREAERLAERLGYAVARAVGGLQGLTASIGFAVFPDEGATAEVLIARADANETDAKRRARQARPVLERQAAA